MKKILIYGDSNVWGDNFFTGIRIPDEKQWPNILQNKLGDDYKIFQEGLPGRLAGDDEIEKKYKNGKSTFISTFRTIAPVDVVIIALGTNDLQLKYNKDAVKIVDDLVWYKKVLEEQYADEDDKVKYFVGNKMPDIIYILPPCFDYLDGAKGIFDENSEKERKLMGEIFKNKCNCKHLILNELSLVEDGIHLSYDGHQEMANLVERFILENE